MKKKKPQQQYKIPLTNVLAKALEELHKNELKRKELKKNKEKMQRIKNNVEDILK